MAPVVAVDVYGGKAGLPGQDGGGCRVVVCYPSVYRVPECIHGLEGAVVGDEQVGPTGHDWEEEAHGDPMCKELASPPSGGGSAFHKGEGGLDQG